MTKETIVFNFLGGFGNRTINFTIYGRPITKKNHSIYLPKMGKIKPSKQFSKYQNEAVPQLLNQMENIRNVQWPLTDWVIVEAKYWMKDRSSWPDYTGLIQATSDILEHVGIIENDSQIITFRKSYIAGIDPNNPRVEISITTVPREEFKK